MLRAVVMLLLALTCRLAIPRSKGNDLSGEVPDALFELLCDLEILLRDGGVLVTLQ